jgi:hypothetical protein
MFRGSNHGARKATRDTRREQEAQVGRLKASAITTSTGLRRRERRFESCRGHNPLTHGYYSQRLSQCPVWRSRGMRSGTNSSHVPLHVDLRPARLSASTDQAARSPSSKVVPHWRPTGYSRWSQPLPGGGAPQALVDALVRSPRLPVTGSTAYTSIWTDAGLEVTRALTVAAIDRAPGPGQSGVAPDVPNGSLARQELHGFAQPHPQPADATPAHRPATTPGRHAAARASAPAGRVGTPAGTPRSRRRARPRRPAFS